MRRIFTNLFRTSKPAPASKGEETASTHCGECNEFKDILYLIMDGEASKDQETFFAKHAEDCAPCLDHYNIEKSVLDTIKEKISKKSCPKELINSIKDQINESPS